MTPLIVGFGLGVAVAAQVGPLTLFLVRTTLRGSVAAGLAVGAGIAVIDTLYAALGAAGAAPVLAIDAVRTIGGLAGAAVLLWLGGRTLWSAARVRMGGEADEEVRTPWRAFVTSLGATASNPLTIAAWASVFAAASTAGPASTGEQTALLLAGVGLGSLTWVSALAVAVALARRRAGPRLLRAVDGGAGMGLVGFGGLLGWRTLHD
jgi:putative LysE/RhtB family amino acid efflux pump